MVPRNRVALVAGALIVLWFLTGRDDHPEPSITVAAPAALSGVPVATIVEVPSDGTEPPARLSDTEGDTHDAPALYELPTTTSLGLSDGLLGVAAVPQEGGAQPGKSIAVRVAEAQRHCQLLPKLPTDAAGSVKVVIQPWVGHERHFGCRIRDVSVAIRRVAATGDRVAALNHIVISVTARPGSDACDVDFVAGLSANKPLKDCRPAANASAAAYPVLHYPPRPAPSDSTRGAVVFESISIERTADSTVLPFLPPRGAANSQGLHAHSLLHFAPTPPAGDSPAQQERSPTNAADAPVRCDQGLYMGFTNIIESLVACVWYAALAQRSHAEFPGRFHRESFGTLFDARALVDAAREWYGVRLTLLPAETPVVSDDRVKFPFMPKTPKMVGKFARLAAARPGARMFLGDIWLSRLNALSEHHQTRWFAERAFRPSARLRNISDTLVAAMRGLAQDHRAAVPAEGGAPAAQWAALHLRLEDDRFGMGGDAAKAGSHTLALVRDQLFKHFGSNSVPAFYACGPLSAQIKAEIPANWRNKDHYFDRGLWQQMYRGVWFGGKTYDITNATGSIVDMFVLIAAPFSVVSEYSSFGEYIAALRCAAKLPTVMYDTKGTFFTVDCTRLILFMRVWHEKYRELGCSRRPDAKGCREHEAAYGTYRAGVLAFDSAVDAGITALRKGRA